MTEYLYAWTEEDVQGSDGGYTFLGMMYHEARRNGPFLMVTDRHGSERICLEEGCAFLDGGNWNVETFGRPLIDKEVKKESKEKKQMTKQIKVGTPVKLIKNTAGSDHKVGDVGTVVMKHPRIDLCWLVEVDGYAKVDQTYSFESDLEVISEVFVDGDYVELLEDYSGVYSKGARGFVRGEPWHSLVEVDLDDGRHINGIYPKRLKKVEKKKTPVTPSLEGLDRLQLRKVIREAQDLLDTEEVTLYSVAGHKWGKKRIPETKLKMTYTLRKGVIQGQPKVENV